MGKIEFNNGRSLEYSSGLNCILSENEDKLVIDILSANGKTYATRNMQEDFADFEAIAFATWSILPHCDIILKYDSYGWNEKLEKWEHSLDFTKERRREIGKKTIPAKICHYSRFLYRVFMMCELYEEFDVDKKNKTEIEHFRGLYREALANGELVFNEPKSKSNIKGINSKGEITENHLEKWFVLNTTDKIENKTTIITDKCGDIELHDQLPCGLFFKKVSEEKRIFNTGYFDLWGANEDTISVFELKKEGNAKLGIISELFFYSCLISDFARIVHNNLEKYENKDYERGFEDFINSAKMSNVKIKAYFLTPEFHSFIDPSSLSGTNREKKCNENMASLLSVMNRRTDNVKYDYIMFDQGKITGDDAHKFVDSLLSNWN